MTAPASHAREHERLLLLDETGLLDTSPEAEFDGLAALAATVTGCPIAFVSLVDEERQFFKARFGSIVTETRRDVSFCAHAIVEDRSVFIVDDARTDPRFRHNPLVLREPRAVFYAGVPVRAGPSHLPLGTLCVIDHAPRQLTVEQLGSLKTLARQVEVLVAHRLHEQQQADLLRRVQSSDERVRAVVDAMHDGVVMQLASGEIVWHNRAAERIFGLTADQLAGRTSIDPRWRCVHEDGSPFPGDEHPAMVTLRTGEALRGVTMGVGVESGTRWIRINSEPMFHVGEHKPWAVVASFTDATELREREAELVRARDVAECAARAKDEFLATVSHELRTPMNGVIGMSELLLAQAGPHDPRDLLEALHHSGTSLLAIINDILDFSKLEAGARTLALRPFDVGVVVEAALQPLVVDAANRGLALRVEVSPKLGALGDPDAVRQVLVNLVGNALKFTERGEVVLRAFERVGRCVFSVRDTGIGISPAQQRELFKPFSQVDQSNTRKFGGTGLGLAISRRLVNAMGSDINLESRTGEGSTFGFDLPAASCPASKPEDRALPVLRPAREPLRVLLVEDNPINQKVAASMLQRLGHHVELACDGVEAVAAASRATYDLVLMDVQMPNMDGLEATRRIRQLPGWEKRRVVALTASVMHADLQACSAAGLDEVLPKPLTLRALSALLDAQPRP